jgi:hypothetical protein
MTMCAQERTKTSANYQTASGTKKLIQNTSHPFIQLRGARSSSLLSSTATRDEGESVPIKQLCLQPLRSDPANPDEHVPDWYFIAGHSALNTPHQTLLPMLLLLLLLMLPADATRCRQHDPDLMLPRPALARSHQALGCLRCGLPRPWTLQEPQQPGS